MDQTQHRIRVSDLENRNISTIKPERNLLAAILGRALCDIYGLSFISLADRRTAFQWFQDSGVEDKPFSFRWVASHLDLDPDDIRVQLAIFKQYPEQLARCMRVLK